MCQAGLMFDTLWSGINMHLCHCLPGVRCCQMGAGTFLGWDTTRASPVCHGVFMPPKVLWVGQWAAIGEIWAIVVTTSKIVSVLCCQLIRSDQGGTPRWCLGQSLGMMVVSMDDVPSRSSGSREREDLYRIFQES